MRTRLLLLALAALSGCDHNPVQTAAHITPAANQLTAPTDSTGRGGNVMGGGH